IVERRERDRRDLASPWTTERGETTRGLSHFSIAPEARRRATSPVTNCSSLTALDRLSAGSARAVVTEMAILATEAAEDGREVLLAARR
ncbi:hypothetical protein PMAYCL1PPCAC_20762, partial [Pristionchus mayeri]